MNAAIAGCVLLMTTAFAYAQSEETWRKTPPPVKAPATFKTPRTIKRTLPNGLRTLIVENHRAPIVACRLGIYAGGVTDPADSPGLASVVASMLQQGTERRSALELREYVEMLGGSVGASANEDFAIVSANGLSENTTKLLELLEEVALHPAFPPDEVELKKRNVLQTLRMQKAQPDFLLAEKFNQALYGDHPYGILFPTPESIEALSRERLVNFHRDYYTPQSAVLVIVGDIKPSTALAEVTRIFGKWAGSPPEAAARPLPAAPTERKIFLVHREGSVQSNVRIGQRTLKRTGTDYVELSISNAVLGGGTGARLFSTVREKHGYAYSVSSGVDGKREAGGFAAVAQTRTDVTAAAIKEILRQIEQLRNEPPSEAELDRVKSLVMGQFALRWSTPSGVAESLIQREMNGLPEDYYETYQKRVMAITPEKVRATLAKYLNPDTAPIVVVGDAGKLRDPLKVIGQVEESSASTKN